MTTTIAAPHRSEDAVTASPYAIAQAQFDRIADRLGLDGATRSLLRAPLREIQFLIPIRMDDGSRHVFRGVRVQHNNARGPFKGGVRLSPRGDVEHIRALAMWMTWKCAIADLPLGGAKGWIDADPRTLSMREQELLCRGWVRQVGENLGPDIDVPAPDLMSSAQHMAWMLDEFETLRGGRRPGFITGKPMPLGGSPGRVEATGHGVVTALALMLERLNLDVRRITAAVQGFGNVAQHTIRSLVAHGGTVTAVSCWDRTEGVAYTYEKSDGIDVDQLARITDQYGSIDMVHAVQLGYNVLPGEAWLDRSVDVLIPAATEEQITAANVDRIHQRVRMIVEGANGPTTPGAEERLLRRGIVLVPDVLANAGGVTVSYFEQVQGNTGLSWSRDDVLGKLGASIAAAFRHVVETAEREQVTLRDAAYIVGVGRVAEATRLRGWV